MSLIPPQTAARRALLSLCAAVLLIAATGQPEIPNTPAGKAFEAWLTSFNSGVTKTGAGSDPRVAAR